MMCNWYSCPATMDEVIRLVWLPGMFTSCAHIVCIKKKTKRTEIKFFIVYFLMRFPMLIVMNCLVNMSRTSLAAQFYFQVFLLLFGNSPQDLSYSWLISLLNR